MLNKDLLINKIKNSICNDLKDLHLECQEIKLFINNKYNFSDSEIGPYSVVPPNVAVYSHDLILVLYFLYHDIFLTFDFSKIKTDPLFISDAILKQREKS